MAKTWWLSAFVRVNVSLGYLNGFLEDTKIVM